MEAASFYETLLCPEDGDIVIPKRCSTLKMEALNPSEMRSTLKMEAVCSCET
jgi:hypothetical protein